MAYPTPGTTTLPTAPPRLPVLIPALAFVGDGKLGILVLPNKARDHFDAGDVLPVEELVYPVKRFVTYQEPDARASLSQEYR